MSLKDHMQRSVIRSLSEMVAEGRFGGEEKRVGSSE